MNPIVSAVVAAVAAVLVGYFGLLANRARQRSDARNSRIDQYQEDIAELRKDRDSQQAEIRVLQRQVRVQGDYIGQLRRHIADGQPPPPPPYPDGLIT